MILLQYALVAFMLLIVSIMRDESLKKRSRDGYRNYLLTRNKMSKVKTHAPSLARKKEIQSELVQLRAEISAGGKDSPYYHIRLDEYCALLEELDLYYDDEPEAKN